MLRSGAYPAQSAHRPQHSKRCTISPAPYSSASSSEYSTANFAICNLVICRRSQCYTSFPCLLTGAIFSTLFTKAYAMLYELDAGYPPDPVAHYKQANPVITQNRPSSLKDADLPIYSYVLILQQSFVVVNTTILILKLFICLEPCKTTLPLYFFIYFIFCIYLW